MSAHMMRGASQKTYKHKQQTCIRPRCTTTANFPDPHNPFGKKKAVCGSCRNKALRELDSSPGFDVYGQDYPDRDQDAQAPANDLIGGGSEEQIDDRFSEDGSMSPPPPPHAQHISSETKSSSSYPPHQLG